MVICAIGVAAIHDSKQLVYISSWNRPSGRYFVELETAPVPGSEMPDTSVNKFDTVDREELACIVAQHLTPHPQLPRSLGLRHFAQTAYSPKDAGVVRFLRRTV